jgi:hypothetical protein
VTEREQRELAWLVADGSEVFDFERALELVRRRPVDAEKLIRMRKDMAKRQEERARAHERLKRAIREEFG